VTDPGLMDGDPFSIMALINEAFLNALIGVGPESIALDVAGTSFDVAIANGAIALDETNAATGFPPLALFDNGFFVGFDFFTDPIDISGNPFEFSVFEDDLEIINTNTGVVDFTGTGTFEISPE
jgi:hypothetical protein